MGNTTADTEWPSSQSLSEEKKLVLDSYFSLLDTPDPTNGAAIAGIFTPDGCIVGPAGKIQGSESTFKVIEDRAVSPEIPFLKPFEMLQI